MISATQAEFLPSTSALVLLTLSTIGVDPAWESRVAGVMSQMNADDAHAAR
jgi:hypothetical protein